MDLTHLSDETLLANTEKAVGNEREAITFTLHHIKEVDRRRLYSALKFSSLHEYCVKKLGYADDAAYRRIAAMRLLREIPEIEEKINTGALTLTHLGMAQTFFNKEAKATKKKIDHAQKVEFLEKLEDTSTREAEKLVISASTDKRPLVAEKIRPISETDVEIRFIAKATFPDKVQKIKGALAHSHPNLSLEDFLHLLCDHELERIEGVSAPRKRELVNVEKSEVPVNPSQAAINREVKRIGACENCKSAYALQNDHIHPRAWGGNSMRENLRRLCRSCNQRAAIEKFGVNKMEPYLRPKS